MTRESVLALASNRIQSSRRFSKITPLPGKLIAITATENLAVKIHIGYVSIDTDPLLRFNGWMGAAIPIRNGRLRSPVKPTHSKRVNKDLLDRNVRIRKHQDLNDIDQKASVSECAKPDRLARTLETRFGVLRCHLG